MKVCLFGRASSPFVIRWAEFLSGQGHEVHVISFADASIPGATVHYIKPLPFLGKLNYFLKIPKIRGLVRRIAPDVINAHYISSYGYIAAKMGFRPVVQSVWGSDVFVTPHQLGALRRIVQYTLDTADVITSECPTTSEYLERTFSIPPSKIETFAWGIQTNLFLQDHTGAAARLRRELDIPESAPVVMSVRSTAAIYGTLEMVEAMPAVLKRHPNAHLLLFSGNVEPDYRDRLLKKAEELGVKHRVRYVDRHLSHLEMAVFMKASDIQLSIPSSDSASTALLEGMLCGLVSVVSDIPTNREVVRNGENGFVIPYENSQALGEVLIKILDDLPGWKSKFVQKNKEFVLAHHDWNKLAPLMPQVYQKAIRGL
ncbi:MAG TPA: glycosyltransferase [bacterium]|nr:glycosyltransferase [bacterium]